MFNIMRYFVELFGMNGSVLLFSFLFLLVALVALYNGHRKFSFGLIYLFLTYFYFFLLLSKLLFDPIKMTYFYYFCLLFIYHCYFTFSKRFLYRTIVIIKIFLNNSEYFKLILWIVLIFITSLFTELFTFLIIFNGLFALSIATGNFILLFFLLVIWIWTLILVFCNRFNVFTDFLLRIRDYFSRGACLHYIGNNVGQRVCNQMGTFIVCTPIVVSIPGLAGFALNEGGKTGQFAYSKMDDYKTKFPNSTHDQQYKIYTDAYKGYANNSLIGRGLTKLGFMVPAAPGAIIPEYKSDLSTRLDGLNKK